MVIGQLTSHETNRRRVSNNNNISQLLRDSFFVSQQPPSWDPCSHYSMVVTEEEEGSRSTVVINLISIINHPEGKEMYKKWLCLCSFVQDAVVYFVVVMRHAPSESCTIFSQFLASAQLLIFPGRPCGERWRGGDVAVFCCELLHVAK